MINLNRRKKASYNQKPIKTVARVALGPTLNVRAIKSSMRDFFCCVVYFVVERDAKLFFFLDYNFQFSLFGSSEKRTFDVPL